MTRVPDPASAPAGDLRGRRPASSPAVPPAVIRLPGEGERLHVLADEATFRIAGADSGGAFSLVELVLAAGGAIAPHSHGDADEALYVLEGRCVVRLDETTRELVPGACAFAPGGVVHAVQNASATPVRLLMVSVPAAGAERVFVELAAGFAGGPGGSAPLARAIGLIASSRGVGVAPDCGDAPGAAASGDPSGIP